VVQPVHVLVGGVVGLLLSLFAGAAAVQPGLLWAALLARPWGGGIAEVMVRVTRGKRDLAV